MRRRLLQACLNAFFTLFLCSHAAVVRAQTPTDSRAPERQTNENKIIASEPAKLSSETTRSELAAKKILRRVVFQLAAGPAFEAKVRQRVWTTGREVVGVGKYEQAGKRTGQFQLQMTMFDGDGKHTLQQISDGRLAWTRTQIADDVSLRRVDVSRLDEWTIDEIAQDQLPMRLRVGGWIEILESIERDYRLQLDKGKLENQNVWVITGELSEGRRTALMQQAERDEWPVLYPAKVRVVISETNLEPFQFGQFLPRRIEYWSLPMETPGSGPTPSEVAKTERLITLIELHEMRPISRPPSERFRFQNRDAEVNFVNETDRYLQLFGVDIGGKRSS